jgi:hypothetical protein
VEQQPPFAILIADNGRGFHDQMEQRKMIAFPQRPDHGPHHLMEGDKGRWFAHGSTGRDDPGHSGTTDPQGTLS